MKRLVVKIGSSTLTTGEGRIDHAYLEALARQVSEVRAQGWQVVIVSSGAIACGLERLGMSGKRPDDMPTLQAAASVGQGMFAARLNAVCMQFTVGIFGFYHIIYAGNIVHCTRFVIGVHNGNKNGIWSDFR